MARMQAFSVVKDEGSFFSSVFSAWFPPSRLLHYPKMAAGCQSSGYDSRQETGRFGDEEIQ